ncbi:MAG: DMT family transporter [Rhodobacteraceae bacterium]|nr:DMT family transporter [Paracoccaceae bacterium]
MAKNTAILFILSGATCMSLAALLIRLIDQADGFQILTYRSISLAAMIVFMACLRRRTGPWQFLRSLTASDCAIGCVLAMAFTTYVFALLNTSVASALFILTAAPVMAAILGWIWINERPSTTVWLTIAAAILGVTIMVMDGFGSGRTLGNTFALFSALFFAIMLVMVRRTGQADVLGGTFLGGVISCLLAGGCGLTMGSGLAVSGYDLAVSLIMGAFTIGVGIGLVTWGTPFVPAAEVSVLVLLESVLSPFWVWLFLGEAISKNEMIGGAVVLAAVMLLAVMGRQRGNRQCREVK